ncbi:MAG TPA: NifB/NifX family molybdenum-iron cluster-binding protein [Bacteroidales bacterium]|jgi:predicted Fe-Mo cluster-binding NifX family protein|nr:NifB/NifX family molybdenum-iron cluster-binding protein [Bacteroidales bacterium]HRS19324.1 NifB/NifX family molybdenum-iron cluster-binding protein [Bacteroidales bacterium]
MKIAVPTRQNYIDDHFGHCEMYTIYTVDEKTILEVETIPSTQGCGCKSDIAKVLQNNGVTVLLAGNMGAGALQVLQKHGITVLRGNSGEVTSVVHDYLQGKLTDSGIGCASHESHHGHGHNGGHNCSHSHTNTEFSIDI